MAKSKTAQRGRQPGGGKGGQHGRPAQRARAIEARKAAEAADRRRRIRSGLIFGTILLVAVAAIVGGVWYSLSKDGRKLPTAVAAAGTTAPPWPAPAGQQVLAGIQAANLRYNATETFGEHYHAHLDIIANGTPVAVPAGIGNSNATTGPVIAEIHNHPDVPGILHIEAPDKTRRYVLGQFFVEWGIKLDATHLGSFTDGNGKTLVAYVNGKKFTGNPAQIELLEHREIALVFGTPDQQKNPPSTFDWAANKV